MLLSNIEHAWSIDIMQILQACMPSFIQYEKLGYICVVCARNEKMIGNRWES